MSAQAWCCRGQSAIPPMWPNSYRITRLFLRFQGYGAIGTFAVAPQYSPTARSTRYTMVTREADSRDVRGAK